MSLVVDALKKLKTENNPQQNQTAAAPDEPEINYIEDDGENISLHKPILATALVLIATAAIVTVAVIFTGKENPITSKAVIVAQKDTNATNTAPTEKKPTANQIEKTSQQTGKTPTLPTTDKQPDNKQTLAKQRAAQQPAKANENKLTQTQQTTATKGLSTAPANAENTTPNNNPASDFFASWGNSTPPKPTETTPAPQLYSDPLKAVNTAPSNTEKSPAKATIHKETTAITDKTNSKHLQPNVMPIFITPQPVNRQTLIQNAKNAFNKKDYQTALKYYLQAYELKQDESLAENIAMIYVMTGNPLEAVKFTKDAKISNASALGILISEMTALAYFYEANELIKYSAQFKDNGELAYAEGKYHIGTQNFQKAEAALKRATSLNPKNPRYLVAYAEFAESQGNGQQAKELYMKALELNPAPQLKKQIEDKISKLKK
ncbi:MAG: tetratricopeptide repeat protein [Deferribacterales bacterium]|nr:tetratricopeptide repeat protein [Deferribacterales bacterium]